MRVSDGLWHYAEQAPDQLAIVSGETRWTYRELREQIRAAGVRLQQAGLGKGDRVAICLANGPDYLACFLAAARYGLVAATLAESAPQAERALLLEGLGPQLLVDAAWWTAAAKGAIGPSDSGGAGPAAAPSDLPLAQPDDPFYIGFTSGSTGRPKGVVRRHQAWVRTFAAATGAFGLTAHERFLVPGPLYFSASLFAALHTLEVGGTLFLERRFSPRRVAALLAEEGITGAFMVPTLYQAVLDEGAPEPGRTGSVRTLITCGEKLRPALRRALEERFSTARVYEYYGSSEVGFMTLLPPEVAAARPESVGMAFPGVQLQVRTLDGMAEAPQGEAGVLHARSEMTAAGYDSPGHTLEPFPGAPGGWVRTGDLARIGPDGVVVLEGRADDAINSGGATVFPAEIESALAAHPAVAAVVAVGLPDPLRGEEIAAAVALRPGAKVGRAELRAFCAARLAPFKRPRTLLILQELPRTETGKLSRQRIKEIFSLR